MTDVVDVTSGRAPVEWRAATVADVRYSDRIVEVVAVPYDEETVVEYQGRLITESVLPGAFDGVDTRPNRVTVNRDHDYARTVGITRTLQPGRSEGLIAELRISPTVAGDETLELANDGALGASVGMAVRAADQRWSEGRSRRHIMRAFLDHIALVANPAYAGAGVLAVRAGTPAPADLYEPVATPRLDEVLKYLDRFSMP
jgi:HK97 family phage prohead protease